MIVQELILDLSSQSCVQSANLLTVTDELISFAGFNVSHFPSQIQLCLNFIS